MSEAGRLPRVVRRPVHAAATDASPTESPEPTSDPQAEMLFSRAKEAAERGAHNEAKQYYRTLLARFPRHVKARNNFALLLDATGDSEGALREIERALADSPTHLPLRLNQAAILASLTRYTEAETLLRELQKESPDDAEILYNLGLVLSKKDKARPESWRYWTTLLKFWAPPKVSRTFLATWPQR